VTCPDERFRLDDIKFNEYWADVRRQVWARTRERRRRKIRVATAITVILAMFVTMHIGFLILFTR
jgi:hypothetical protein